MVEENELSYLIRGAIFKVHNELGPGLLESVYVAALVYELNKFGLRIKTEVPIRVIYDSQLLQLGFRLDILINNLVIIEVKSVELLAPLHHKQLITYLKLSGKRLGVLVNFNVAKINDGIFRKVNGLN